MNGSNVKKYEYLSVEQQATNSKQIVILNKTMFWNAFIKKRNFKTVNFCRISAQELAAVGVRVNSVNPGVVYTEVFDNLGM